MPQNDHLGVADLRRKLMRYIRAYAQRARPFRWNYTDPNRRVSAKRITGTVRYKPSLPAYAALLKTRHYQRSAVPELRARAKECYEFRAA
jgi:hypothetical protein